MSALQSPVSDMLLTVKSREVQRATYASMGGNFDEARKHFLAAAHLELVLADDYEAAGECELSRRSRIGAASCFWRANETTAAHEIFRGVSLSDPSRAGEIQDVMDELASG